MVHKLTKRLIDSIPTPPRGTRTICFDTLVQGFALIVHPTGRRVFVIEYGPKGRRRRYTLGPHGSLTAEKAREKAMALLGGYVDGIDPARERNARSAMPTFGEWAREYVATIELRKKAARHDRRYLVGTLAGRGHPAHVAEAMRRWGTTPLSAVAVSDVQALVDTEATAGHRTQANRLLASLRACLQAAWRAGIIAENVALRVRLLPENAPRIRVLSDEEMARFSKALDDEADPFIRTAFALLVETGARKSEVLQAKWEDLDLDAGTWRVPSPKAGRPQTIPLAGRTVALLRNLPRTDEHVIPGRDKGKARSDLRGPWEALKLRAGIPDDVHIHDLRRSFGLRVTKQAGVHVASKLLRHSGVTVTERVYAPLALADLREAAEQAAVVLPMRPSGKRAKQ
jgi:integrase